MPSDWDSPRSSDDVMAEIHWDFPCESMPGVRISGVIECRSLSVARQIVEKMNDEHGPNTHWCVPMNYTHAEKITAMMTG